MSYCGPCIGKVISAYHYGFRPGISANKMTGVWVLLFVKIAHHAKRKILRQVTRLAGFAKPLALSDHVTYSIQASRTTYIDKCDTLDEACLPPHHARHSTLENNLSKRDHRVISKREVV
jgi:hypothetical protein